MVCVNKFDLNPDVTYEIEEFAKLNGLKTVGRIPFDPAFTRAMVNGQTVIEYDNRSQSAKTVKKIWKRVLQNISWADNKIA